MDDRTRYAEERSQGARRPLAQIMGAVSNWARASSDKFVAQSWNLVDVLADAIRAGQYDLGVPYTYSKTLTLLAGTSDVLTLNVRKFGMISNLTPIVTNMSGVGAVDAQMLAGITNIQIGAQTFYEQQDGTLVTPDVSGRYMAGFVPNMNGLIQPESHLGYLRRIPVAQGDIIQVDVRNIGLDDYQVGLVATQYGALPPALGR